MAGRVSAVEDRVGHNEAQLAQVSGKADKALERFEHLRLERHLVLGFRDGAQFDFDSARLSPQVQRQIDRVAVELAAKNDLLLVIAGHTDNIGSEDYNFELGQHRAASVARYLISRKGFDPLRVTAISYGPSAPIADNASREGRERNRRIEILVYREDISAPPGGQRLDLERTSEVRPGS
jgi:outer membrane protein OmpA-like peptidoglycan-associated protein